MSLGKYIVGGALAASLAAGTFVADKDYKSKNFIRLGFENNGYSCSISKETEWQSEIEVERNKPFCIKFYAADSDGIKYKILSVDGKAISVMTPEGKYRNVKVPDEKTGHVQEEEIFLKGDPDEYKASSGMLIYFHAEPGSHDYTLSVTDKKGNKKEALGRVFVE